MKYHWIGVIQVGKGENQELAIPHQSEGLQLGASIDNALIQEQNSDENFQPQIIPTKNSNAFIANMSKVQVKESCLTLLKRTIVDAGWLELAVGNCVISNYRDTIIEIRLAEGEMKSTQSRQAQIRRSNLIKICRQSVTQKKTSNEIEKQLLFGICLSKKS